MASSLGDFVEHILLQATGVKESQALLKAAETTLLNALTAIGEPLKVGGSVVIGNYILKRQYEYAPIEITKIPNLSPQTIAHPDSSTASDPS